MIKRARMLLPGLLLCMAAATLGRPGAAHAADTHTPSPNASAPHSSAHRQLARRHTPPRHVAARRVAARPVPSNAPIWSDVSGTWRQTGVASWYGGKRWQGRRTSSGDRYDENQLTAAHATLPLGSRVRVVVPGTGRSVVVTINDRPGSRTRIIDLSRAAAAELGILNRGVATVTLLPANVSG